MEEAFKRDGLPVPQKVSKKRPCVQPADMLAWELFRYDRLRPARRSLLNLLKGDLLVTDHGKFLEDNILESFRKMGVIHHRDSGPRAFCWRPTT